MTYTIKCMMKTIIPEEMMFIRTLGINYQQNADFVMDRPPGAGAPLLLIFKTAAFVTLHGTTRHLLPGSAILYAKDTPQLYGAEGCAYVDHCIHMDWTLPEDFPQRSGLTFDTPFRLNDLAGVEALLRELSYALYADSPSGEDVTQLLLRLLLYRLGESCCGQTKALPNAHARALNRLRADIYATPAKPTSVADMAAQLNLSPAHLQRLYREQFGVSCYEDVLNARMQLAKHYLLTTDLAAGQVSELCGYEHYEHFARQFREKCGMPPGAYRKKQGELRHEIEE